VEGEVDLTEIQSESKAAIVNDQEDIAIYEQTKTWLQASLYNIHSYCHPHKKRVLLQHIGSQNKALLGVMVDMPRRRSEFVGDPCSAKNSYAETNKLHHVNSLWITRTPVSAG
jgi:hypothetical protein